MKFELKGYQEDAAAKVLSRLLKGSAEYASDGEFTAVSLSAPTGAGKTVIATAVIERLLFGDPDTDLPANPDFVAIWLTDDPSLNEQTRKKILEASDRVQPTHLATLDESFDQPELDKGKVYFLNIQKLSKTSKLVIPKEGKRTTSLWTTITNTVRTNGANLYLIIDEAHRGTGKRSREDQTIAQRLMNGNGSVAAVPVVLGISATPERFDRAVAAGSQERLVRKVSVPISLVRESGLIKDVLSISYRAEAQAMETTLVRQAVGNLKQMDAAWAAYTEAEGEPAVRPVLVLQIPPNARPKDVGALLDVCVEEWEVFGHRHAAAHSLESHVAVQFGRHTVDYVKPQNIHDHPTIRLVIFKEALTTGWDCPRAEVMVSLRAAKDSTYIAQLIGRMVRAPLARRIESDETLNRVRLYLPNFDEVAVTAVKAQLESDEGGLPTDIELNSVDAHRNAAIPSAVFDLIAALPSYQVPGPIHRSQVARLHKLAALMVGDGLIGDAIKVADDFLVGVMEGERARLDASGHLAGLLQDAKMSTVGVMEISGEGSPDITMETYLTDIADVNRLFARARRKFRDGLADAFWGHRVTALDEDAYEAKLLTVALSSDAAAVDKVEEEAADRVRQWLDTHGDAITVLSEDKKAKYAEVRAMAREPEVVNPGLPSGPITMTGDAKVPTYRDHLYSDPGGEYRIRFGTWEHHVLSMEVARDGFVAWYRNPSGGQRALRVPFETESGYGKLYPDFVFVHASDAGQLRASIVDPHGHHLSDAADKLRGLADYAEKHAADFSRVVSVIRSSNGEFRLLDMKDPTIRAALTNINGTEAIEKVFAQHGSAYD